MCTEQDKRSFEQRVKYCVAMLRTTIDTPPITNGAIRDITIKLEEAIEDYALKYKDYKKYVTLLNVYVNEFLQILEQGEI